MRRRLTGSTACPEAWRWFAGPLITQETEQGGLCCLCRSRAQVCSPEQPFPILNRRAAGVRRAPRGGSGVLSVPRGRPWVRAPHSFPRGGGAGEPRPRGLGMSGLEDTPRGAPKLSSGDPKLQTGHRGLPLTSSRSVFLSQDTHR